MHAKSTPRACPRCGTTHTPTDNRVRYCSRTCANASHPYPALSERAWDKVDKGGGEDGCWPWTGALNEDGYGQCKVNGKQVGAHRVIWELTHGPIPDGLKVLHKCDNPPCCNPRHLFLGTNADNMADMIAKGRQARGERHGMTLHPESYGQQWRERIGNRPYDSIRGANNTRAKLTEGDVREIRRRREAGEELKPLAREFGVSFAAISQIARRKSWRHVA